MNMSSTSAIKPRMRILAQRCFYRARKNSALRRLAALPGLSPVALAIARRVVQLPGNYPDWIGERLQIRRNQYPAPAVKGLLSFLTTVWNTPIPYLHAACESLLCKQTVSEFEWVVLDNGTTDARVRDYLASRAASDRRIKYLRVEENLGIIGGMRRVLTEATGRYVAPFDSDDTLYPDTVSILTDFIQSHHFPALLYSDEDKLDADKPSCPYFKPDWDPVLFLNSCFIAHLGCFNRETALELGIYTDPRCDGSHDWDTFLRFLNAGHSPVHIPEMLYSWRMHRKSTACNIYSKNYIHASHRAVLGNFLAWNGHGNHYELCSSPLFNGTPDWWFRRKRVDPKPLLSLTLSLSPENVDPSRTLDSCDYPIHAARIIAARSAPADVLPLLEGRCGLVAVLFDTLRPTNPGWAWEALGLTELHPDAVVIASRVVGSDSQIKDAGRVLGFAGLFGCPDRGRHVNDPGFAAQMWKQRSVSGASTHFCVFDVAFMRQVLQENADRPVSWFFLGAWAAVSALKSGRRVIYSPLLSGVSDFDIDAGVSQEEMDCFRDLYGCYLPDSRYYPRHFDLQVGHAYEPISEMKREAIERQMFPREPGRRTRWSVSNAGTSRDQGAFEQLCVPSVSTRELG